MAGGGGSGSENETQDNCLMNHKPTHECSSGTICGVSWCQCQCQTRFPCCRREGLAIFGYVIQVSAFMRTLPCYSGPHVVIHAGALDGQPRFRSVEDSTPNLITVPASAAIKNKLQNP